MNGKEFFKRFQWGTVFPVLLTLAAGIAVLAAPVGSYLARSVTVGVFFSLAGIVCLAAFFLETEENPLRLIAGVAALSAALWLFITVTTPVYVFCIAMAVVTALRAGGDAFDAIRHDGGWRRIVRCIVDALLLGLCIVVPCDPFGKAAALLRYTGAVMIAETVWGGIVACLLGLFEEEEVLHFRTVKK